MYKTQVLPFFLSVIYVSLLFFLRYQLYEKKNSFLLQPPIMRMPMFLWILHKQILRLMLRIQRRPLLVMVIYHHIKHYVHNLKYILLETNLFSDEDKAALPLLSESLVLDNLWETLSACLLELEYTPDHHAVLVLQVNSYFCLKKKAA